MLDHLSIAVADLHRSGTFYDAVLHPLGYARVFESRDALGYAPPEQHDDVFAIRPATGAFVPPAAMHIAFKARTRDAVIRFHEAAVALGAASDGEPQLHPMYGEGYFAAFVIDPDGYRLEAVYHEQPDPLISLKEIDDETLDELLALAISDADPKEVMAPIGGPDGWNEARRAAFRAYHESRRSGLDGPHAEITFAIVQHGRVLGSGRLARRAAGALETGMWLARSARGRGIGSQALRALKERALACGAARLIARTTTENVRAIGALRNCGAKLREPDSHGHIEAEIPL